MAKLLCSCCGNSLFSANQYHGHDRGYGTCEKCIKWRIERAKPFEFDELKLLVSAQFGLDSGVYAELEKAMKAHYVELDEANRAS